ncbi:MAG: MarR family transcriptional regulator [Gammaproteobacteria bacterium]|jgi:DNA-binding MarR family transcriptional regulator
MSEDGERIADLDIVSKTCANGHLRQAARVVTRAYDHMLAPTGLKSTQFSLLATTTRLGPRSITELADILGLERSTLSRNLKVMEKDGLIRVSPEGYKRTRRVEATPEGKRRLEAALPYWKRAQGRVVQKLGSERFLELRDLLAEVGDVVHPR